MLESEIKRIETLEKKLEIIERELNFKITKCDHNIVLFKEGGEGYMKQLDYKNCPRCDSEGFYKLYY